MSGKHLELSPTPFYGLDAPRFPGDIRPAVRNEWAQPDGPLVPNPAKEKLIADRATYVKQLIDMIDPALLDQARQQLAELNRLQRLQNDDAAALLGHLETKPQTPEEIAPWQERKRQLEGRPGFYGPMIERATQAYSETIAEIRHRIEIDGLTLRRGVARQVYELREEARRLTEEADHIDQIWGDAYGLAKTWHPGNPNIEQALQLANQAEQQSEPEQPAPTRRGRLGKGK